MATLVAYTRFGVLLITRSSIDERKFKLLNDKTAASDVTLDGHLIEETSAPEDWNKILRAICKPAGVPSTGDEVDEAGLRSSGVHGRHFIHPRAAERARRSWRFASRTQQASDAATRTKRKPSGRAPAYSLTSPIGEQTSFFG